MRDHRKLRVFQQADVLAVDVYSATGTFLRQDQTLCVQLRRAAVSVSTNIVEGSARRTTREYLNFLNVALASAAEAQYLIDLSARLQLVPRPERDRLFEQYSGVLKGLQRLISRLEPMSDQRRSPAHETKGAPGPEARSLKPEA